MAGLFVTDMTPEQVANARKWIDALRSGRYKQGRGQLHSTHNTFCCLGVGCDVAGVNWDELTGAVALPLEQRNLLGLNSIFGTILGNLGAVSTLADLNDFKRWNFARIADVIEAELALVVEVTA